MAKLLVVEDNADLATAAQQSRDRRARVETVETARTRSSTSPAPSRLAGLDLMLPGLDATRCCGGFEQRARHAVLILTARAQEADKVLGFRLGADDYVTKRSGAEVMARVAALLPARPPGGVKPVERFGAIAIDRDTRTVTAPACQSISRRRIDLLAALVGRAVRRRPTGAAARRWGHARQWSEDGGHAHRGTAPEAGRHRRSPFTS